MSKDLLAVGRKIGLENVSAIKNLKKCVKSGNAGTYRATLKMNGGTMDGFYKELPPEAEQVVNIAKEYFPKSFASGVDQLLDIVVKRFGKKSGAIELSSVSKNADEVLGTSRIKAMFNDYGIRLLSDAKAENVSSLKLDAFIKNNAGRLDANDARKILNGIDYKEADGISKMTVKAENAGALKKLDFNMEVPTGYVNNVTKICSDGQDFNQLINMAKSI